MSSRTNAYNEFAAEYSGMVDAREGRAVADEPMIPELLALLGDLRGLEVLDAGCGEGYLSRLLASRGARVTGVDISPRLVERAREKDPDSGITFLAHDLSTPLPGYMGHFDLVASHFVLNDVPDYLGFVATLAAALKPGGRAVLTMNNPYSFVVRGHIDDYFDSGTAYSYRGMAAEGVKVYFYQHTLQEYIDAFLGAGFRLARLLDVPTPRKHLEKIPDRVLPPRYQFPFYMILSFVKE